jgi:FG-GAP repeat
MITDFTAVPDWFPFQNAGAGLAVGDVDGDGRPDLVVLMVDDPQGQNAGYYQVGWGVADGEVSGGWSAWAAVPDWFSWANEGAGVAVADHGGRR